MLLNCKSFLRLHFELLVSATNGRGTSRYAAVYGNQLRNAAFQDNKMRLKTVRVYATIGDSEWTKQAIVCLVLSDWSTSSSL